MYYDRKEGRVHLSVRELCAFAGRGGDLDYRHPRVSLYRQADGRRDLTESEREEYRHLGREVTRKSGGKGGMDAPFVRVQGSEMPRTEVRSWKTTETDVPLSLTGCFDGVMLTVEGKADRVIRDGDGNCTVEKVYPTAGSAEAAVRFPEQASLSELCCLGCFLCQQEDLPAVTLRFACFRRGKTPEAAYIDSTMTREKLEAYFRTLLPTVLPYARDRAERESTVRAAADRAVFPYPSIRPEQGDMIRELWRDMREKKTVFAQAPTGIGKTMAALYPAVRCYGEDRCDRIFYLTAKNAARREAFAAVRRLFEGGTPIRACVITAREHLCLLRQEQPGPVQTVSGRCRPDVCPYAKGYYDRVDRAIFEMIGGGSLFSGKDILAAAKQYGVCPYELSLDLSELCEVIVCDYNYVFSPSSYLRRYFSGDTPEPEPDSPSKGHRFLFLVDEAHNLPDRARDMYAGSLCLSDMIRMQELLHGWEQELTKTGHALIFPKEDDDDIAAGETSSSPRLTAGALDDIIGILSRTAGLCRENMVTGDDGIRRGVALERSAPVELHDAAASLSRLCGRFLRQRNLHPLFGEVEKLRASLQAFCTAFSYFDARFVTFIETEGEDVRVRVLCLDPSEVLKQTLRKAEAKVLFSATLTPTDYFADILGGDRDSVSVSFSSPFPEENLCVTVCDGISTRFEDRRSSIEEIVRYIAATISGKKGHYMVYFPSYAYLEKVHARFRKRYANIRTVVQKPSMSYADREAFIQAFTDTPDRWQVGFCVLGGSFSEGVDLPGRSLIGVLIVGVGIPGLSNERNIMKEYYDETREGDGYAYAYIYPGMNRVLQAAGRVIRRSDDRGVVVLLDDRYREEPYLHLYPSHWTHMVAVGDPHSLSERLKRFWQSVDPDSPETVSRRDGSQAGSSGGCSG